MAQYPTSAATDAHVYVAVNNKSTTLNGALLATGDNTSGSGIAVTSTSGFPSTGGYITIEDEAIKYTGISGNNFTGITRGADGTTAATHSTGLDVKHMIVAAHHNSLADEVKAIETDLVALNSAITPVTAASTATSVLNRIAMIVSQIKNGFGLTNWYDAVTAMLPKSGGTMSGNIAMGGNKLTGLAAGTTAGDSVRFEQVFMLQKPVRGTTTTGSATTSSSYTNTALAVSITPTVSSSRILIFAYFNAFMSDSTGLGIFTVNGTTTGNILAASGGPQIKGTGTNFLHTCALVGADTPGTTSAQTYTLQMKTSGGGTVNFGDGELATIIAIEVTA